MRVHNSKELNKSPIRYYKIKVLLLGDEAVGKTSLIRKYVLDEFHDKYIATIGTKVTKKELELEVKGERIYLTLLIWDVLGQKGYRKVQLTSFKGADGVILVCDFTREETLRNLEDYWLKIIDDKIPKIKSIFVANKSDLADEAEFPLEELEKLAFEYDAVCFPSSAKTGENVEEIFYTFGKILMESKEEGGIEAEKPMEILADEMTVVDVTDWLIGDFCKSYGDMEMAMPVIRRQFDKAEMDIREPTKKGLLKVINQLADVERDYKDEGTVKKNRTKRRLVVERIKN